MHVYPLLRIVHRFDQLAQKISIGIKHIMYGIKKALVMHRCRYIDKFCGIFGTMQAFCFIANFNSTSIKTKYFSHGYRNTVVSRLNRLFLDKCYKIYT